MDNGEGYVLFVACIRKTIIQVGVLVRVASSDVWNDYNTYNKGTFFIKCIFPCHQE